MGEQMRCPGSHRWQEQGLRYSPGLWLWMHRTLARLGLGAGIRVWLASLGAPCLPQLPGMEPAALSPQERRVQGAHRGGANGGGADPKPRRRETHGAQRDHAADGARVRVRVGPGPPWQSPTPASAPYPHLRASRPRLRARYHQPEFWSPGPGMPDPTLLREEAFVVVSG